MTGKEALETLKENFCAMCAYGSQNMMSCDIRYCDNREAIKVLEREPCEDAIRRKKVIDTIYRECSYENLDIDFAKVLLLQRKIKALPSVLPEPKTGHWIPRNSFLLQYKCSECGWESEKYYYCPNCGAKMVENEEQMQEEENDIR